MIQNRAYMQGASPRGDFMQGTSSHDSEQGLYAKALVFMIQNKALCKALVLLETLRKATVLVIQNRVFMQSANLHDLEQGLMQGASPPGNFTQGISPRD